MGIKKYLLLILMLIIGTTGFMAGYNRTIIVADLREMDERVRKLERENDSLIKYCYQTFDKLGEMEKRVDALLQQELYVFPRFATPPEEWQAICFIESGYDEEAVNTKTGAVGIAQIRKVCIDDVNRILGEKRYSYQDRFDPLKSREIFEIYTDHYTNGDFEKRARVWHSGPDMRNSNRYWAKVEKELEK